MNHSLSAFRRRYYAERQVTQQGETNSYTPLTYIMEECEAWTGKQWKMCCENFFRLVLEVSSDEKKAPGTFSFRDFTTRAQLVYCHNVASSG